VEGKFLNGGRDEKKKTGKERKVKASGKGEENRKQRGKSVGKEHSRRQIEKDLDRAELE